MNNFIQKAKNSNISISSHSRIHAKMKPDEILSRINSWITKEVDCDITNLTFIYSGHGMYDGL
jgi:hypothetical protein